MVVATAIDIFASAYNNFTNPNLAMQQKWAFTAIDATYAVISTVIAYGVTALVALIPGVGPFLAPLAGIGVSFLMDWWWQSVEQSLKYPSINAPIGTAGSGFGGGGGRSR